MKHEYGKCYFIAFEIRSYSDRVLEGGMEEGGRMGGRGKEEETQLNFNFR